MKEKYTCLIEQLVLEKNYIKLLQTTTLDYSLDQ